MQRTQVLDGGKVAESIDYSFHAWKALTLHIDDGALAVDNNHDEQQIRTLAPGRANWLFAGSMRTDQRAATIMSLIQSAKLNGHGPTSNSRTC